MAVNHESIVVGTPMPFSVYNAERQLLLAKGRVVESERMRDILIQQGKFQSNSSALQLEDTEVSSQEEEKNTPLVEGPMEAFTREFHASIGQARVGVRLSREENGEGFPCWVIGADEAHGLIVTAPAKPDRSLVPASEGQAWTFRMMYLTAVVKFQATVRKMQFEPVPLLIFTTPKNVEMRQIRVSPRVAVCFKGTLDLGTPFPMLITDLSTNGMRIATLRRQVELKAGQRIKVGFTINVLGKDYTFKVPATVIASRHEFDKRHPELHFVGVKIEAQSETEMLVLHSYVYERSATEFNALWKTLMLTSKPNA